MVDTEKATHTRLACVRYKPDTVRPGHMERGYWMIRSEKNSLIAPYTPSPSICYSAAAIIICVKPLHLLHQSTISPPWPDPDFGHTNTPSTKISQLVKKIADRWRCIVRTWHACGFFPCCRWEELHALQVVCAAQEHHRF